MRPDGGPRRGAFTSVVTSPRGGFRILEGVWESPGFLDGVINVVEGMPRDTRWTRLADSVYAILRLSDLICETPAGRLPWDWHRTEAPKSFKIRFGRLPPPRNVFGGRTSSHGVGDAGTVRPYRGVDAGFEPRTRRY